MVAAYPGKIEYNDYSRFRSICVIIAIIIIFYGIYNDLYKIMYDKKYNNEYLLELPRGYKGALNCIDTTILKDMMGYDSITATDYDNRIGVRVTFGRKTDFYLVLYPQLDAGDVKCKIDLESSITTITRSARLRTLFDLIDRAQCSDESVKNTLYVWLQANRDELGQCFTDNGVNT